MNDRIKFLSLLCASERTILFHMRQVLALLFVLTASTITYGISTQEIVQLSKLKTGDELLIDLIQKSPLDKSITTQDALQMKDAGVSDRVISYLLQGSHPEKIKLPEQEGESVWISENIRVYRTRDKNGKVIEVVTNLDEQGKRVGGEIPAESNPPDERYPEYVPEAPREIYVTVRHEDYGEMEYGERDYESTEAYDSGYRGIPLYSGGYYPGYYPGYYSGYYKPRPRPSFGGNHNRPMWQNRARGPIVRPSAQSSVSRSIVRSSSSITPRMQVRR